MTPERGAGASGIAAFRIRVDVRSYELDQQGHVNNAVYLQYADHAWFECVRAAGVSVDDLLADGIGPVVLETTIRFHRELRAGDEVDVSCAFTWSDGRTYRMERVLEHPDGTLVATVTSAAGLLDLQARRLLADPGGIWRSRAARPTLLGLPDA